MRNQQPAISADPSTALADGDPGSTESGVNTLDGTILDASYVGVSTQYLVKTSTGQQVTVYRHAVTDKAGVTRHVKAVCKPVRVTVAVPMTQHFASTRH